MRCMQCSLVFACEFVLFSSVQFPAAYVTSGADEWHHTRVRSKSWSCGGLLRPSPSPPAFAAGAGRIQPPFAREPRRRTWRRPRQVRERTDSQSVAGRLLGLLVHALWGASDVIVRGKTTVPRDHAQSRWRHRHCRQRRTVIECFSRHGRLRRSVSRISVQLIIYSSLTVYTSLSKIAHCGVETMSKPGAALRWGKGHVPPRFTCCPQIQKLAGKM